MTVMMTVITSVLMIMATTICYYLYCCYFYCCYFWKAISAAAAAAAAATVATGIVIGLSILRRGGACCQHG